MVSSALTIMLYLKTGSLEVRGKEGRRESQQDYKKLRKALCAGYASQLAERMIHHNGYRPVGLKSQLVQVATLKFYLCLFVGHALKINFHDLIIILVWFGFTVK